MNDAPKLAYRSTVTYDSKKHSDLRVQTIYANKKRSLATATDEQASVNTPKATSGTAPIENIPYNDKGVKRSKAGKESVKFSLSAPVEETKELVAVHNMRASELIRTLDLGGLPMPSIAIIKAQSGHSEYGDVSLVERCSKTGISFN